MTGIIIILSAVIILCLGLFIALFLQSRKGSGPKAKKTKGRDTILRNATRRLNQNPRDPQALRSLGDLYFREESWEKALKTYQILCELGTLSELEAQKASIRFALCAQKLGRMDDAYQGFTKAKSLHSNDFEVNYNLGVLEFDRKNYDKAVSLLTTAHKQNAEHIPTLRTLGHACFRINKNKEAMTYIRRAIELAPDDKESVYTLAECYHEANQIDQALKLFSHLRGDPVMGSDACLRTASIYMENRSYDKAIADMNLGLRHENIKPETRLELLYRLALCCLKKNDIGTALIHLKAIQHINPAYKDVSTLIAKYQELNTNRNLQIYLLAPQSDFVALCRKIVMVYFPRTRVKITNITVTKNDWADITADVDASKWSDTIIFRFIRSQGAVGELIIRDFHSHIKDNKAGKGICISVGTFTDEAKRFTEARLIDLIGKDKLTAILNTVDAKAAAIQAGQKK
jgi:tetratricopeptide (TPR) repeat protein